MSASIDEAIEELRKKLKEKNSTGCYGTVSLEVIVQNGQVATLKVSDTITFKPAK